MDPRFDDIDEADDFPFDVRNLESPDDDVRRWAIIEISKQRMTHFEDRLIEALSRETDSANRRHIVRALGNIMSRKATPLLVGLLQKEEGLILGEIAEALGKLEATDAAEKLQSLLDSPIPWVANASKKALKRLRAQ